MRRSKGPELRVPGKPIWKCVPPTKAESPFIREWVSVFAGGGRIITAILWRTQCYSFWAQKEQSCSLMLIVLGGETSLCYVSLVMYSPHTQRIAQEAHYADLDSGDTRATSDI